MEDCVGSSANLPSVMDCLVAAVALPRAGRMNLPGHFFSQEIEKESPWDDSPAITHLIFCEAHLVHARFSPREAERLEVGHVHGKARDLHASQSWDNFSVSGRFRLFRRFVYDAP